MWEDTGLIRTLQTAPPSPLPLHLSVQTQRAAERAGLSPWGAVQMETHGPVEGPTGRPGTNTGKTCCGISFFHGQGSNRAAWQLLCTDPASAPLLAHWHTPHAAVLTGGTAPSSASLKTVHPSASTVLRHTYGFQPKIMRHVQEKTKAHSEDGAAQNQH